MKYLPQLFERNRAWAARKIAESPDYFERLCAIHRPDLLWIGCSDSRVPANEIVGMDPGELFVHRNVANVAPVSDVNTMAVVEFAVDTLGVRHIIVCGHYHCGGVEAVLRGGTKGAAALWLQNVRQVADASAEELAALPDLQARWDRLCELNVQAQVRHLGATEAAHRAWCQGAPLAIHGWIYDLKDGIIRDLGVTLGNIEGGPGTGRP
jgi:carbonic anhydrase